MSVHAPGIARQAEGSVKHEAGESPVSLCADTAVALFEEQDLAGLRPTRRAPYIPVGYRQIGYPSSQVQTVYMNV